MKAVLLVWTVHTSYLSFLLHIQDFRKPNFTPKKTTEGTKNTKNVSEKVKYMHFFTQSGKIYTWQKIFTQAPPVVPVTNMRYAQQSLIALAGLRKVNSDVCLFHTQTPKWKIGRKKTAGQFTSENYDCTEVQGINAKLNHLVRWSVVLIPGLDCFVK